MEFDRDPFDYPSYDAWRAAVERDLKGADFDKRLVSRTDEGLAVQPLYGPVEGEVHAPPPGVAPFVRGASAERSWRIRQSYAEADPEAVAAAVATDVSRGVEGVEVRLDRAFRLGRPGEADANVGLDGCSVVGASDLARILESVALGTAEVVLDAGANPIPALAMLATVLQGRRADPAGLRLVVAGDPLGALARDGELPGSLEGAWDDVAASIARVSSFGAQVRVWVNSTRHLHDSGADAALELGLGLASAIEGLRALDARGVEPMVAAGRLEWQCGVGRDIFVELAKLRATRLVWFRALELCGAADAAAALRVHAACSRRTLTRRDPWVNMLRGTSQSFSAIVGGADSVTTAPFDEALGRPDTLGRRVARNTQLVLRLESHLDAVADPAGGSWYVEELTSALASRAWEIMQSVERAGGMGEALAKGLVAAMVQESADASAARIRRRSTAVTGVSSYANPGEALPGRRVEDRAALAARRAEVVARAGSVKAFPGERTSGSRVDAAVDAASVGATVDGLTAALRSGVPARALALGIRREAEEFEALMDAADAHAAATGEAPRIFMAAVGPVPKHKARATWTTHFFHAGGLRVVDAGPADDAAAAVAAFVGSGASAAVVVAHDELHAELLPSLVPALREAGARWVAVAGRRSDAAPCDADAYAYVGCDVLVVLEQVMDALEVKR